MTIDLNAEFYGEPEMPTKLPGDVLPFVRRDMEELVSRVLFASTGRLLWERLRESDRATLGKAGKRGEGNAVQMWVDLYGVSPDRAILDVGLKCDFLTPSKYQYLLDATGLDDDGLDIDLIAAIKTTPLVRHESPRGAYWEQEEIELRWEDWSAVWRYFWMLAVAASRGAMIDEGHFDLKTTLDNLNQWKYRLTNHDDFPKDLEGLIVVKEGKHKLDLPPKHVRCFRRIDDGRYEGVTRRNQVG